MRVPSGSTRSSCLRPWQMATRVPPAPAASEQSWGASAGSGAAVSAIVGLLYWRGGGRTTLYLRQSAVLQFLLRLPEGTRYALWTTGDRPVKVYDWSDNRTAACATLGTEISRRPPGASHERTRPSSEAG